MENGIFIWRLQLLTSVTGSMNIGIQDYEGINTEKNMYYSRKKPMYAYCADGYTFCWDRSQERKDLQRFKKQNDKIIMKLELSSDKGILKYTINDGDEFTTFTNILRKKDLKYRLAVSFYEPGLSMKLE